MVFQRHRVGHGAWLVGLRERRSGHAGLPVQRIVRLAGRVRRGDELLTLAAGDDLEIERHLLNLGRIAQH